MQTPPQSAAWQCEQRRGFGQQHQAGTSCPGGTHPPGGVQGADPLRAGVPRIALLLPFPSPRCGHALLQHRAMLRAGLRQLCAPPSPTNHGMGRGRAGEGGFQPRSVPTFGHAVAPTREGRVAAPRSDDALLQARHQQGQSDMWVLCLPPLPGIKDQHLSPLYMQAPCACPQTCCSWAEAQAKDVTSKVLWS